MLVIKEIIFIHNFCTDIDGHNQIWTVIDLLEYERVISTLVGYDRIFQYYLHPGDYVSDDDKGLVASKGGNESDWEWDKQCWMFLKW